ncbi:cation:proton antiporter [Porticoccaceae bacterium]|nr:cation:proton antiporter [Porticoccaceae bacterium]MDB4076927.1 cation:proton antiporter [Porticoccaceae bacterium]MDB4308841.1 cation:proton antiporter [Porticoccaceae bacterium]MDB9953161.1 cation:proton antiporter [Porticoccaceae bacterium]MDC0000153.1 cation:proton antiporter [Porticoccaceae bacterium]
MDHHLIQLFFLIFTGSAVVASLALFGRQPLLVAYILLGAVMGPHGLAWVTDVDLISEIASIGIIFLLFLLGLDMQPQALGRVLRQVTHITLISSLLFAAVGFGVAYLFEYSMLECIIIGTSMMFSSTIIGIKLLPTTVLHHKHSGELMIGMLLMQDFLAIFVLLMLISGLDGGDSLITFGKSIVALPLIIGGAVLMVRYVLQPLFARFDRIGEYVFLLAIGWCLGVAELAEFVGLSREIGAFIAGISLATSPISQYIALNLKPLRDFFLILFFFSLGGGFDLSLIPQIAIPALILAALMLALKPTVYQALLRGQSESQSLSWDIGFRLGQNSEFSLLIAYVAFNTQLIGNNASHLIQAAAIITFLISSYIVVFNFPNPIATSGKLRRD